MEPYKKFGYAEWDNVDQYCIELLKEISKNPVTEAEKNFLLNFSTNDSELFAEGFDEIDEEHIIQLAEQWSLDPDNLFGMEEQECVIADIN